MGSMEIILNQKNRLIEQIKERIEPPNKPPLKPLGFRLNYYRYLDKQDVTTLKEVLNKWTPQRISLNLPNQNILSNKDIMLNALDSENTIKWHDEHGLRFHKVKWGLSRNRKKKLFKYLKQFTKEEKERLYLYIKKLNSNPKSRISNKPKHQGYKYLTKVDNELRNISLRTSNNAFKQILDACHSENARRYLVDRLVTKNVKIQRQRQRNK